MTCKGSRRSIWGAPGAKLSDFGQKERPHHAFVRLVGGDKKSMELCPVYAENWNIRPKALSAETKPDNLSHKEGEGAARDAAADVGIKERKQAVRKKRSRSSVGDAPVQPHTSTHAPTTSVPEPEPLVTQRTTSRSGRVVAASPLRGASQVRSTPRKRAPSTSTASNPYTASRRMSSRKFAHHPAPAQPSRAEMQNTDLSQAASTATIRTTSSTAASSSTQLLQHPDHSVVSPATGALYGLEDSTTQRATSGNSYVPHAYSTQVADGVRIGIPPSPLLDRHSREPPACTTYQPYNPMPVQYVISVPHHHGHIAWHGPDATSHAQTIVPRPMYMVHGTCASTQPAIPLDSYTGNGGSRMHSSLPTTGIWPWNTGIATSPSPHTPPQPYLGATNTYDPSGDTKDLGVAYQDFNSGGGYRPPSSLSSRTMPDLAPGTSERDLKFVRQAKRGYDPQAYALPLIDDVGVVARYSVSDQDQDPHTACETCACQLAYPPEGKHSIAWAAPSQSAIATAGCEQSAGIGGAANSTYVYDPKAPLPARDQLAMPRTISNGDRHLPKQSSYSELSQALGEPASTSMQESTTLATNATSTVPPNSHSKFYAHSSSSAPVGPYAHLQDPRPRRRPPSVWYEHSPRIAKCAQSASTLR